MSQAIVSMFTAVVIGILFFQLDLSYDGIQNRFGLLYFISLNVMFANTAAIELFIAERIIFVHENASGFYGVTSYFCAKILNDVVFMRLVPIFAYCVIIYLMAGLQADVGKFFIFFFDLFLAAMCAAALCFAVSASVSNTGVGQAIVVPIFILMMVFGGLLVNLNTMFEWLNWMQYLSCARYSINTLMINELKELTFYDSRNNRSVTGSEFLDRQAIPHETTWELWRNIMALGILAVCFLCLAYVQLRRMKKFK